MQYFPFENQKTQMVNNKSHCHCIELKNYSREGRQDLASNDPGWPISRILSGGKPAWMDIYLGWRLPVSSSGLPGDGWERGVSRCRSSFSPA